MSIVTTAARKCETYRLKLQELMLHIANTMNEFHDALDADRNSRYSQYRYGDDGFELLAPFTKQLKSNYDNEEKLVNDCLNSKGLIMSLINKSINDCKKATMSASKYMSIKAKDLTESDKSKLKLTSMAKVYNDLEFAECQGKDLVDAIDIFDF